MRIYLIILLLVFVTGCTPHTLEYRRFKGQVEEADDIYRIKRSEGPNTLLEIYKFGGAACLIPMAWDGYSLFIEIPQEIIVQNRSIEIPNDKVSIKYLPSYHHGMRLFDKGEGKITFNEITEEYLIVDLLITIESYRGKKVFKGNYKFVTKDISEYYRNK